MKDNEYNNSHSTSHVDSDQANVNIGTDSMSAHGSDGKRIIDRVPELVYSDKEGQMNIDRSSSTKVSKSGPGMMLDFMLKESAIKDQNRQLQSKLEEYSNCSLTKKIESCFVVRSIWSNRLSDSYTDSEFVQLKSEIQNSGGNIQPIKVRPKLGQDGYYEIIYGHRRHQACLELNIPVLAMIESLDESELFIQMYRENRGRKNLRPFEQGVMYAKALDAGLFPSARKMAEVLGTDLTNFGRALSLARLPEVVICAFKSPHDMQYRWASELTKALRKNPEAVISVAKSIPLESRQLTAKETFEKLIDASSTVLVPDRASHELKGAGGEIGSFDVDDKAKTVNVKIHRIQSSRTKELHRLLQNFLAQDAGRTC